MKTAAEYQLQACRNLERTMLDLGWPADAAYFRRRQQQLCREFRVGSGNGLATSVSRQSPLAGVALLSVCGPERVNVSIGARFHGGAK